MLCTPKLSFWHPGLVFLSVKKSHGKVCWSHKQKSLLLSSFSQSVYLDTWNAPWQPWVKFLARSRSYRSKTENFHTLTVASEKFLKLFICTRSPQFWKSYFTVLLKAQVFFCTKSEIDRITVFLLLVSPSFFFLRT